jgi:RHS repeat-associated protein
VFWALSDHQGTVRDWLTSAGASQKHVRYDSFGRITSQVGTLSNRFWYTGREWDSEIGLYYYRARYYDPGVGRFIGEDPIGFGGQDPNLYRYVANHSTGLTDPYGLRLVSPVVQPGTSPLVPPAPPPVAPPPPPPVPAGAASLGISAILGIILAIPVILLTQEGVSDGTYKQKPRQRCKDGNKKKTCQSELPHLIPCADLPSWYLFPSAADAANEGFSNGYRDSKSGRLAEKGPCRRGGNYEPGYHWNVNNRSNHKYIGSVGQCTCCEENPTPHASKRGAVLRPDSKHY